VPDREYVKPELTGFRNQWFSQWHRTNLPSDFWTFDLDMMWWIEANRYEPIALLEVKRDNAPAQSLASDSAQLTVMRRLCDRAALPLFLVVYTPAKDPVFLVSGQNDRGRAALIDITHMRADIYRMWTPGFVCFESRIRTSARDYAA
jgi:hypothetical protein